jgi:hypothetical protein
MNYKTQQEAIDAFIAQSGDDFVEFDGQNCNDYLGENDIECAGWQVGNRRCDCGNRRVHIETGGDNTNGFYAFALAW